MLLLEVCGNPLVKSHFSNELKGAFYVFAVGNSVLNPFVHSFHIFFGAFVGRKWMKNRRRMASLFTTTINEKTIESSSRHHKLSRCSTKQAFNLK